MDLMNLKPTSDTVVVQLLHPNTGEAIDNDDGSAMTVTVYASHSKEHKAVLHEQTNKRIKMMSGGKVKEFTSEDIEEATLSLLSKITAEWDITYNGKKPALTVAIAKELYNDVFWIKDQVEGSLAEALDFTKA